MKLEIIKKCIGLVALIYGAFIAHDIYVLVAMSMLTGVIATMVNAWPNKRVISYLYLEQVHDICPAFLLSAAAGALAWLAGLAGLSNFATVFLQALVMVVVYLGLARLFRVEELAYLTSTARQMLASRKGARPR